MKKAFKISLITTFILSLFCCLTLVCSATESIAQVKYVAVKNVGDGVFVKWTSCEEADTYKLYRKTDGSFTEITEVPKDKLSFTDSSVKSGKSYTYKVLPCKGELEGECAKPAVITFLSSPQSIKTKNVTGGVTVSWKTVQGADRYTIYRRLPSEQGWSHAGSAKGTNFTDKNVKNNGDYLYTVRARKGNFKSDYNQSGVSAHFINAPELTDISSVKDGIFIKWKRVTGAEKYIIYRRTSGSSWQKLTELPASTLRFTDKSVTANKGYAYTLRAVDEKATSGFTSGLSYKFIPVVKVTSVKNSASGLLVTWKKSPYATAYKLYRKSVSSAKWTKIADIKGKSNLQYTDKKTNSGDNYTYTVITVSGKFQSTFDSVGKANTFVAPPQPASVSKSGINNVISWKKVPSATHYYVYRKTEAADSWTKLARVGNTDKYTDTTAKSGTLYLYCLRAGINGKYFSDYSQAIKSSKIDPSKKMIALTYDDGPSNSVTNRILDVLEKYDSRATFFVIGSRVDSNSQPLIRAHKLDCEIGNHTYTHINLPSYSDSSILNEVNKTDSVIKKYTGITPKIIRAPGGATNSRVLSTVNKPFIYWSVDTRDWEHRNSSRTISHIKNYARDGAIILMHDIYPATASASEQVIPWLINQGYQLVTVSELMEYRGIRMHSGTTYYNAYKK